ncbi:MAG: sigma-70 family RNA polymerase sigma factor [Lentilitoribacter sp.]
MGRDQHGHFAKLSNAVAVNRDQKAFAELFDYFSPRIKSYFIQLGAVPEHAEDMSQDVMSALWHKAHLFDPSKSSLSTWLFRVARNRRIDLLRRDRSALIDVNDPIFVPPEPISPDDYVEEEERDEHVRRALSLLQDKHADIIRMSFFLGLSHSQIAEKSGLPLGTVKSRIRVAFQKLRETLEGEIGPPDDL